MFVTAIVAAGGRGTRFGAPRPKQLLTVGGRAILERSVSLFLSHPVVSEVIVTVPPDVAARPPEDLRNGCKPRRIVIGGERRRDSVANAFNAVTEQTDLVVIHDAARPFASADLVTRTIAAAEEWGAALAALPVHDTVKLAAEAGEGRFVRQTL